MEKRRYRVSSQFDFDKLIENLRVLGGSVATEVGETEHYKLIVSEKYFVRINGTACATLLFIKSNEGYEVSVIVSGAMVGLLCYSYGADKKYLKDIQSMLENLGAVKI